MSQFTKTNQVTSPPIITITGGKGGTGKTLIATNLAIRFSQENLKVLLVDCDVENPNSYILLGLDKQDSIETKPIGIFKPEFNTQLCTKCSKCRNACYRHAILQFGDQLPTLMDHLCSGCQTCLKICPSHAIYPASREIGSYFFFSQSYPRLDLLVGELIPTEALSAHIVEHLLNLLKIPPFQDQYDIIIIDSAPGAHCDVEKTILASDMVISVTEPTPFGNHDLKRILELIRLTNQESYVVLNRADLTNDTHTYIANFQELGVQFLGNINVDPTIIEDYAKGIPFITDSRNFHAKDQFIQIFKHIFKKIHRQLPVLAQEEN